MADWSNDIEKYKKGELTSSQMHALEKKALSDPFLADALEGADQISDEQFSFDINEINKRVIASKKNSVWTPLRIAAGIFLILGVSFTMYFLSNETPAEQLAEQASPNSSSTIPKSSEQLNDSVINKSDDNLLTLNAPNKKEKQNQDSHKDQPATANKPLALSDKIAESSAEEFSPVEEKKDATEVKEAEQLQSADLKQESKSSGQAQRMEAVDSIFNKRKSIASERDLSRAKKLSAPSVSGATQSQITQRISGQVKSMEDGQPLPGVNVVIKGTSTGTITDGEGNYSIEVPDQKNAQLVFSFIGVQTIEKPVEDQTNINVQLENDVSQLSEVVVVGYGTSENSSEPNFPTIVLAEPAGGKRAFKKYLETNLHYPEQAVEQKIEGRVTVQFIVKTDGRLDEFTVVKGIGAGCDEEVIRLIKIGPKWSPSIESEKPVDSRMRVRMRFKLPR